MTAGRSSVGRSTAAVRRTWRLLPLLVVLGFGAMYAGQWLGRSTAPLPMGTTATMSVNQGPALLVRVSNLNAGVVPPKDPAVRKVSFFVSMRLRDPSQAMYNGDGLASYCSVLGLRGTVYPSDLAASSPLARGGIFMLQGTYVRSGRVVALLPRDQQPYGVICQIGDDVVRWAA